MNLKRAFQYQNKLAVLLNTAESKFSAEYFVSQIKTSKRSEINQLIPTATFEDEIENESPETYGKYTATNLIKVINLLWTERSQLATGISLAKNKININNNYDETYCYDALLMYNNDRRMFLSKCNLNEGIYSRNSRRVSRETLPTGEGHVSYPVIVERTMNKAEADILDAVRKEIFADAENLSSSLEEALYRVDVPSEYDPIVPMNISFDDLYEHIDEFIKAKRDILTQEQANSQEESVTITPEE